MKPGNLKNTGPDSEMDNLHWNWSCLLRACRKLVNDGSCNCMADAVALNNPKKGHRSTPIVLNRMADNRLLAFVVDWQLEAHGSEASVGNRPVDTRT
jgi:hypothetical protein